MRWLASCTRTASAPGLAWGCGLGWRARRRGEPGSSGRALPGCVPVARAVARACLGYRAAVGGASTGAFAVVGGASTGAFAAVAGASTGAFAAVAGASTGAFAAYFFFAFFSTAT